MTRAQQKCDAATGSSSGVFRRIQPNGRDGVARANGIRLHYLEYGAGEPSILIIPGITSPAITWEFVAEPLAVQRRVIAYDVRGRGLSDKPAAGFTLPDYAADAAGLIEALELRRPIVLGHSMGARIAAALGAGYPELVGPLILVDPPLTGPGRSPYPTSPESFQEQLQEAYAGTTADAVRRFYPRWNERELQLRAEWLGTCDEHAVMETRRLFEVEDFFRYWAHLRPPLLFIYGIESPVVTAEGVTDIRTANPAAEVVGIAGAGHMIPWENLDDFIGAVERDRRGIR